jgi:uncharacterized membrane protein (DUF2068 family)
MLKSHASGTLRAVACLEAAKGSIVLLVGCGLLALIHKNIQHYAEQLIPHLHLNPAHGYPHVFLDLAGQITDARLWFLAAAALAYASVRFIEAYGLWYAKRWAEWFAALSGGIYIPFEIHTMVHHVSLLTLGALLINVVVVAIIASELTRKKNGLSFSEKRYYESAVGQGKPGPYHDQGSQ